MNACAYLRVSGTSQLDGTGFDRQDSNCAALAAAKGFTLARNFEERAIPGWKDEDERPAFQEMVAWMLDTKTSILIIESLDRLARAYRIQEQLILYLAAKGFTLYAANTGENITEAVMGDPMKKALVQIQGIFAELDKNLIVAKLKKGREITKAKTGRCEGRKPFGEDPKLPGEAPTLAEIRRLRTAGIRPKEISATLNLRQLATRSGKPWTGSTVAKILRRHRCDTNFAHPLRNLFPTLPELSAIQTT